MNLFLLSEIESLPENKGVFCFLNEENQTLFVGVAENLKQEICLLSAKNYFLLKETRAIETINSIKQNLIKNYCPEKAEIAFMDLQNNAESYRFEPLIVPIRFDDESGDARDLQPLSNLRSK